MCYFSSCVLIPFEMFSFEQICLIFCWLVQDETSTTCGRSAEVLNPHLTSTKKLHFVVFYQGGYSFTVTAFCCIWFDLKIVPKKEKQNRQIHIWESRYFFNLLLNDINKNLQQVQIEIESLCTGVGLVLLQQHINLLYIHTCTFSC